MDYSCNATGFVPKDNIKTAFSLFRALYWYLYAQSTYYF